MLKFFYGDFKSTKDFPYKIKRRFINPFKSDIGKITKIITEKLIKFIDWYVNIQSKRNTNFVTFGIESLYLSLRCNFFKPSDLL